MLHLEALTEDGKKILGLLTAFDGFYLAGGTALSLQIGHRISVDFDLFSSKPIPVRLLDKVKRTFVNRRASPVVNNPEELTVEIDGVKISFVHYPFPPLLPLIEKEGQRFLSTKEIGITKAYTIGRRGEFKDYIDLYFILSEKHIDLSEIIELATKKYGHEFNDRLFLEQLVYLDDVEEAPLVFLRQETTKEGLKNFFEEKVKTLLL